MTLQTSRNTNKQDINTNFGNPHLTLKEGPKVKSDHTERFPAHDFLDFGLPFQSSRTNNKRVISTFKFGYPRLTLMEGPRSNLTTAIDSQHDFVYYPRLTLKEGSKVKSDHTKIPSP